jgi:hypothetical protein
MDDIQENINHKPVKVPRSCSPFTNSAQADILFAALDDIRAAGLIPEGLGLSQSGWAEDTYPGFEIVTYGRRKKDIVVELPEEIWLPRAIAWGQGLYAMQTLLYQLNDI